MGIDRYPIGVPSGVLGIAQTLPASVHAHERLLGQVLSLIAVAGDQEEGSQQRLVPLLEETFERLILRSLDDGHPHAST